MSCISARRWRQRGQAMADPSGFRWAARLSLMTTKSCSTASGVSARSSRLSNQNAEHGWQMSSSTDLPYFPSSFSCDISWLQLGQVIDGARPGRLSERRAALRAELARAVDPRLALRADDGLDGVSAGLSSARGALSGLSDRLPHRLSHRDTRADPCARAGGAVGRRRDRNRLRDLILRVARQVSNDPHADALVEPPLELVGQRDVLDLEALERQPEVGERWPCLVRHRRRERVLIGRHVEERNL